MFVDLTTTVRLGEIFLIVCHLLLRVTEIDSKSNIRHQVSTFKPEARAMKYNLTPMRVVVVNDKATLKRFLKRTPRKKRNFINMVKQCCNLSINTTTSTCTPFFIRRSKITHRKTTRLKKPIHLSTMQADLSANEPLLQRQEKGKIKKLLFAKHPSTLSSLFVTDRSELPTGKNKSHHDKTTNNLNLLEPSSEKIIFNKDGTTGVSTDGFNIAESENIVTFDHSLSTKHKLRTVEMKTVLPINETTSNFTTIEPLRARTIADGNLRTQVNHIKGSTVSLIDLTNKSTDPFNTSESKANAILKKLNLKDFFHFKKASSFAPSESDRTTTFESGKVLQDYNTLPVTHSLSNKTTENDMREHQVTKSNVFTSFLPNNISQSKRMFHVHHKQRDFFTHCFTEKSKQINSAEPIMEQTTDILETQIPSSSSQHTLNKEDNKSESDLPTIASPGNTSENESKYMHFRNMLHRQRRTTLDKVIGPTELEKDTTLKSHNLDSYFLSGSNFTSLTTQSETELRTDSHSRGNEIIMTRLFNFKKHKEGRESNHLAFEIIGSKEKEVLDQSPIETTVSSKINSFDSLNSKPENSELTTVHNPFKIKYLMKFRSPTASSQSFYNNSSWLDLTSTKTYNDKKGFPFGNERLVSVEITTEPMNTQDNLRASDQSDYDSIQCKLNKSQHLFTKTSLHNTFSIRSQNITDTIKNESDANTHSTLQLEENKESLKFNDIIGLRKYKTHSKNKNRKHNTRKPINPGVRVSRKQFCCYKLSTEDNFMERFNVTVYRDNGRQFRNWFFGKTTRPAINKGHKNEEECTFRWCFEPRFNNSRSITKSSPLSTWPLNKIPEMPTISGQKHTETFSKFPPEKKLKRFFHFKTSHTPLAEYSTTVESVRDVYKELTNYTNTKLNQQHETTTKYHENDHPTHSYKMVSHAYSTSSFAKPEPIELLPLKSTNKILHSLEIVTLKSDLNSTDTVKPNVTIKVYGRGKVKQFFNRFHAAKTLSSNNTFNLKNNKNSSLLRKNGTVILNQEYADYIETKVETKKHKKHSNRTVLHNASDVNDTSFNVMAYVMKPFDSLVSVFKALSPNSVTKIGDVNATDIKSGSLPNHLQPPNSSIVILAVNNTNATSRDVHESKLAMALDLLGGMYHCVFKSFFEARPEDVHFYLYTRSSPEEPEELFLPPEPPNENVTDNADLPQPVLEKKMTTESSPLDKREVEDDEDDYEDYEFEALNPAKSEIQSKRFNVRAETKILIHGYLQDYQTDIMVSMKEAFLSRGPYNVVVVDWSVLVGDSSCYPVVASRGLRQVGGLLAQLLNRLVEAGVSPSSIHIVGFSLGAHVAGHAGTFLNHGLVSRITGLDPALPYVPMEPDMSLDSDDAVFVDIIHSAAGLLGQSGPMGHVDFYPNGGSQQPGCEVSSLSCSHRRAALYFIESINSESGFQATKCESWHHFQADNCSYPAKVLMGEPCPTNTRGKYYLVTGYRSPFSLQPEEHIQVKKSLLLDLFYDSEDL